MIAFLEEIVFRHRAALLAVLGVVTAVAVGFAAQLRIEAGFTEQLPTDHEYVRTFLEYREEFSGVNRVIVVLRSRNGDIWNPAFLARLERLTEAVLFLPGVDRRTVTSLWTPNTMYFEITEEGVQADNVVPAHVLPDTMGPDDVTRVRDNAIKGGFVGRLVATDHSAAMVTAELLDVDPRTEEQLDYLALAARIESEVRGPFEDDAHAVHVIGFVAMIGEIAKAIWPGTAPERVTLDWAVSSARQVMTTGNTLTFFLLAFVLTAAAVYFYSRSAILTGLALFCSLVSVAWQFAVIYLLGLGLDPLAILVPFLVFAIGVSHGVQQLNLISREVCRGADPATAARRSFRGLLLPGSMALVTDLVGFGMLLLIPIGMIQELAIVACIGVAFQIVTNLVLLPVLSSFFRLDAGYVARADRARRRRERIIGQLRWIAVPRNALVALALFSVIFGVAVHRGKGRHVGDLQPGAPELRPDSRYNLDAMSVVERFSFGLDVLTVVVEAPPEACIDYRTMEHLARFSWTMRNVEGVQSVFSLPLVAKLTNAGWTEGNLKWVALPRNPYALVKTAGLVPESTGLVNGDCSLMPVYVFTEDHKAETIQRLVAAVRGFERENPLDGVRLRLASGNLGIMAGTNEVLEASELPMMLWVYAAIVSLVFVTYRDWRATICCCVPLSMATVLGYWLLKEAGIGLKVATMPVMVLAVGLGVDYAFYIYNRLRIHLAAGDDVADAYAKTLRETGGAVVFTAITMAIGVSSWSLSELQFQADMGLLLSFMFMTNMVVAVTMMPALAVVLDLLFPRRRVRASGATD